MGRASRIEEAYERFVALRDEVADTPGDDFVSNEAETRHKLVDPILTDILSWPRRLIRVEQPAGKGRLDYVLREGGGACRFVVEAKARTKHLLPPEGPAKLQRLRLDGPVLGKSCWPVVRDQMVAYLGQHRPAYGVVTNGEQWVAFLSRLLPSTRQLDQGKAAVFRSLEAIDHDFERFFELFAYQPEGGAHQLRDFLVPDGGVVPGDGARRVVTADEERRLSYQGRETFYRDLEQAMDVAFRPILDDPDALERCFVESRASRAAESRLERLANELSAPLRSASEHYPPTVRDKIEDSVGSAASPKDHEEAQRLPAGMGHLARVLGEPTSGKSVFLRRFYKTKLTDLRERLLLVWLDGERQPSFDESQASRAALEQVKTELFGEEGPSWSQLREVFQREWRSRARLRGVKPEDDDASATLRDRFLDDYERREQTRPAEVLWRYLRFAVDNRRRLPCVVVDNFDQGDVEEVARAVAWAIQVHRNSYALVTIAMDDATLWRLRAERRDPAANHAPDQFWLHRPKVREVLEKRTAYLQEVLTAAAEGGTARTGTTIGRARQWRWRVQPDQLVRAVNAVLLDDRERADWLGALCNYDVGEILALCRRIVLSPHVKAEQLLSSQATGRPIPRWSILKAIIAPQREQFQESPDSLVTNVFGTWDHDDWAPLLPARLLALLRHRKDEDKNRREPFPGFMEAQTLVERMHRHASTPPDTTRRALEKLLALHLVEPYDPSRTAAQARDTTTGGSLRVRLTPRGRLHLDWSLREKTYVRLMAEVDPIVDTETHAAMREAWVGFIDGIRGDAAPTVVRGHEQALVRRYVGYALEQAARVSPLADDEEVRPAAAFERALRRAWGTPESDRGAS